MINVNAYKTVFFDCDGVILDSNLVKANAYTSVLEGKYEEDIISKVVDFHITYPSFNRFEVFGHFFREILKVDFTENDVEKLAKSYGEICREGLLNANETEGLREFLDSIRVPKFVVTGGIQKETRFVLDERGISAFFNGIYGSPKVKVDIINYLFSSCKAQKPALFIGDSDYDYASAMACGVDFIFMSQYSGLFNYSSFFADKNITIVNNLSDLL
tara:strand:- start:639 stop:1286 length:648 start_codon:yes stop_codon:yes gene_type:complete